MRTARKPTADSGRRLRLPWQDGMTPSLGAYRGDIMKYGSWTVPAAAAVLCIQACYTEARLDITEPYHRSPATTVDEFEWRGAMSAGDELEIKGVAGGITARPAAGRDARILAQKTGYRDDARSVRIEVVRHRAGVTICAVYPDRPGHPGNSCQPGDHGTLNSKDNDVEVQFEVAVPDGVRLVAKAVAGSIDADRLEGDVVARTVAGNIRLRTRGAAEASTVAGSIDAELGSGDWGRDLDFTTVSGGVTVRVPGDTNADVELRAGAGEITSDFPLEAASFGRWVGKIGSGGRWLRLSTLSGGVRLQRAN